MTQILFGVTVPVTAKAFLIPQMVALIEGGWQVHLVCNPDQEIQDLKQIKGLTVHELRMERSPSPVRDLISLYRWNKLLKHMSPDIVVGSTPKAGLLSMIAARWNRIPVRIYHVRGFRAEGLSGIQRKISLLAEKISTSKASVVLLDSFSLKEALIDSGCLRKDKGVVLGAGSCCGVNTDFFRPPTIKERTDVRNKLGLAEDVTVIGFVGRITRDKGIEELVEAIEIVREKCTSVHLVLAGPNESGSSYLMDFSDNGNITYIGPTVDVRSTYWAFDVFVLPSHREGFPISPLEAQACGLPLITTTATGCVDSQSSSNSKLLVPIKDPISLANAINLVAQNPTLRSSLGMDARKWVLENFRSTEVVCRNVNFLKSQELLGRIP